MHDQMRSSNVLQRLLSYVMINHIQIFYLLTLHEETSVTQKQYRGVGSPISSWGQRPCDLLFPTSLQPSTSQKPNKGISVSGFSKNKFEFFLQNAVINKKHLCCTQSLSRVHLFVTPWTVARQAPLSMRFSRQEHWSRLPCPPPGQLPNSGNEPKSPTLLHCRKILYPLSHLGRPPKSIINNCLR